MYKKIIRNLIKAIELNRESAAPEIGHLTLCAYSVGRAEAVWGSSYPCAMTLDHALDFFVQLTTEYFRMDAIANNIISVQNYRFLDLFEEASEEECVRMGTSDGEYVPDSWEADEWRDEMSEWD